MKKTLLGVFVLGLALSVGSCGYKGKAKVVYDMCMSMDEKDASSVQDLGLAEFPNEKAATGKKSICKNIVELAKKTAVKDKVSEDEVFDSLIGLMSLGSALK